jgi:hypothetical protein
MVYRDSVWNLLENVVVVKELAQNSVIEAWGLFGDPGKIECPALEDITRGLEKTQATQKSKYTLQYIPVCVKQ